MSTVMSTASEPRSPCISVCALDDAGVCIGCYRTADEITEWMMASPEEKHAIVARAERRRDGSGDGSGTVDPA
jgi:predicted Fe-S protein YdhL (DUF1289 family)